MKKYLHWTDAEHAELVRLYPHNSNPEIGRILGRTESAVLNRAIKYGLKKADGYQNPGCRQPGEQPWNAGLKGWKAGGRSAETRFRSGNQPDNRRPLGHERVTREGYLERKVSTTGVSRRDFRPVHHLVWEEAGREIPPGHVLVFVDGDKRNFDLENLRLLSRAELLGKNSVHNLPKPVARAVQLLGCLRRQLNKRSMNP